MPPCSCASALSCRVYSLLLRVLIGAVGRGAQGSVIHCLLLLCILDMCTVSVVRMALPEQTPVGAACGLVYPDAIVIKVLRCHPSIAWRRFIEQAADAGPDGQHSRCCCRLHYLTPHCLYFLCARSWCCVWHAIVPFCLLWRALAGAPSVARWRCLVLTVGPSCRVSHQFLDERRVQPLFANIGVPERVALST